MNLAAWVQDDRVTRTVSVVVWDQDRPLRAMLLRPRCRHKHLLEVKQSVEGSQYSTVTG